MRGPGVRIRPKQIFVEAAETIEKPNVLCSYSVFQEVLVFILERAQPFYYTTVLLYTNTLVIQNPHIATVNVYI